MVAPLPIWIVQAMQPGIKNRKVEATHHYKSQGHVVYHPR